MDTDCRCPRARQAMPPQDGACRGFALLFALIAVALVSFAAAVAVSNYRTEAQRERERELLFVGEQIRAAIAHSSGYTASANAAGAATGATIVIADYPKSLEDLLLDRRQIATVRHLRRIYIDPMTGKADWVLEKLGNRVVGVHSRAAGTPLIRSGFTETQRGFANARSYADWHFSILAGGTPTAANVDAEAAPPANNASGSPAAPAPAAPAVNMPAFVQSNFCSESFETPQGDCGNEPPPYGNTETECLQHFQAAYSSCMAGISGQ